MSNSSECIFCAIVKGDIPSYKVYEDNFVIAILDINPATKGHTLVIPKEHYDTLEETPQEVIAHMFKVGNELASKIKEKLGAQGYNILANVGKAAGQVIFHTHIHIVPRYTGDSIRFIADQKRASDDELKSVYEKIKEA